MSQFGIFGREVDADTTATHEKLLAKRQPIPPEEMDYPKHIFKALEALREPRRTYIGASSLGYGLKCARQLWYRQRRDYDMEGRVLRLLDHGNSEEDRLIRDMRKAGIQVTGEQLEYKVGKLIGHIDALVVDPVHGLENLEVKTSNKKRYIDLVEAFKGGDKGKHKKALEGWRIHNAQMQLAMGALKLKSTLYVLICKDNDELHFERVPFDKAFFAELVAFVETVSHWQDDTLPARAVELPDQFGVCMWCPAFDECWDNKIDFNW